MWSNIGGSHPRMVSVPPRLGLWARAAEGFRVAPASAIPLSAKRSRRERVIGASLAVGQVRSSPAPESTTRSAAQSGRRTAVPVHGNAGESAGRRGGGDGAPDGRDRLSGGALHEPHAPGARRSGALRRRDVLPAQAAPLGRAGARPRSGGRAVQRDPRPQTLARGTKDHRAGEGSPDGSLSAQRGRSVPPTSTGRDGQPPSHGGHRQGPARVRVSRFRRAYALSIRPASPLANVPKRNT